jgi:hypothetical protein
LKEENVAQKNADKKEKRKPRYHTCLAHASTSADNSDTPRTKETYRNTNAVCRCTTVTSLCSLSETRNPNENLNREDSSLLPSSAVYAIKKAKTDCSKDGNNGADATLDQEKKSESENESNNLISILSDLENENICEGEGGSTACMSDCGAAQRRRHRKSDSDCHHRRHLRHHHHHHRRRRRHCSSERDDLRSRRYSFVICLPPHVLETSLKSVHRHETPPVQGIQPLCSILPEMRRRSEKRCVLCCKPRRRHRSRISADCEKAYRCLDPREPIVLRSNEGSTFDAFGVRFVLKADAENTGHKAELTQISLPPAAQHHQPALPTTVNCVNDTFVVLISGAATLLVNGAPYALTAPGDFAYVYAGSIMTIVNTSVTESLSALLGFLPPGTLDFFRNAAVQ